MAVPEGNKLQFLHLLSLEHSSSLILFPLLFYFLQGGEKLGYETEAFAIYDVMRL